MTYTLGTAHSLSGSGSVAVSSPVGLKVALASVPAFVTQRQGTPLEYSGLGWLALGNPEGYLARQVLHHTAQLVYPIADGMTLLGYSLLSGTTATVTELVDVPGKPVDLVDRNGALYSTSVQANDVGVVAQVSSLTYTVPTGRWLLLQEARMRARRTGVATSQVVNVPRQTLAIAGIVALTIDLPGNLVNDVLVTELPGPVYLPAGTVIDWSHNNPDTGGTINHRVSLLGLLFDA
jgi:hypothetical protein